MTHTIELNQQRVSFEDLCRYYVFEDRPMHEVMQALHALLEMNKRTAIDVQYSIALLVQYGFTVDEAKNAVVETMKIVEEYENMYIVRTRVYNMLDNKMLALM